MLTDITKNIILLISIYVVCLQEYVTFQVIFTTDGQNSYTFYNYKENGMNLRYNRQFIGIINGEFLEGLEDSSDGSFLRRPDQNLVTRKFFRIYSFIQIIHMYMYVLFVSKWLNRMYYLFTHIYIQLF